MVKTRTFIALVCALALACSLVSPAALGMNQAYGAPEQVTLIGAHDAWSYEDSNTDLFGDPSADFRSYGFDDSAWKLGAAPLGYPATETSNFFGAINAGGTLVANRPSPNAYITYYLRNHFAADELASITTLTARLAIDDGCILYLNGHEIYRINMPAGAVDASTIAVETWEATESRANVTVDLSAYRQYLVVGDNILAADVHNRDNNSSDIYFGLTLTATYDFEGAGAGTDPGTGEPQPEAAKTPAQLNVHVGDDAATQVNVSYTTVAEQATSITLTAEGAGAAAEPLTVTGVSSVGAANKYFHKIAVSGLAPNTRYTYVAGVAPNTVSGSFKTAPLASSEDAVRFVYLADTQVSNATNAEALGATLAEVSAMDPDFVYLAGDVTDTATSEEQWEWLFTNSGAYPTGGADMFRSFLIAAVQGNHDNNTFNRHINAPAEMGNIVYSFDYGPLTFVMLNLETARADATARAQQRAYLEATVAEAKARGQWVAVGFHKSLYTGASHVVDSDVIEARSYWCPVFAQLDVDFVLQGHDHVYSRGFVNEAGYNAGVDDGSGVVVDPTDVPLYMVGGHAGGLKWYSKINYTVSAGDPLAPAYSFLDLNSADPATDPFGKGQGTDVRQEQVIVEFVANRNQIDINTYMFKYDEASDTITTPKYLFDSLTITRGEEELGEVETAALAGPVSTIVENNEELYYTVSYSELAGANAFDTAISYDPAVLELSGIDMLPGTVFATANTDTPGVVRVIQGVEPAQGFTSSEPVNVVTFAFKLKAGASASGATASEAIVTLTRADTVRTDAGTGTVRDIAALITAGSVVTALYSEAADSDLNGDGKVTLADLALALGHYRETGVGIVGDVNHDGVVDAADFVIISTYLMAG